MRPRVSIKVIGRLAVLLLFGLLAVFAARPAGALTPNEKYVTRIYQDFLLRSPTSAELIWGAAVLGSQTRSAYVTSVFAAAPFRELWITGNYARYADRAPTSSELSSASSALSTSGDYLDVELDLLAGSDYFSRADSTNGGFVDALYADLLWRDADTGGYDYWVGQLNTAAKTRRQVATWIIRSSESANRRVSGLSGETTCLSTALVHFSDVAAGSYCIVLDRMADSSGASYWAGQLASSGQLPTLWVSLAASTEYYNLSQI